MKLDYELFCEKHEKLKAQLDELKAKVAKVNEKYLQNSVAIHYCGRVVQINNSCPYYLQSIEISSPTTAFAVCQAITSNGQKRQKVSKILINPKDLDTAIKEYKGF